MNPELLEKIIHLDSKPQGCPQFGNFSKIFKQLEPGKWQHIPEEPYKKDTSSYKGITRFELVGKRGESIKFHTRYFEIENGGFSSYEKHDHEHVVVVMRGKGEVRLGCRYIALEKGDVIYISPQDPHQFLNPELVDQSNENFGFLCMVHAERDLPKSVDSNESCQICE